MVPLFSINLVLFTGYTKITVKQKNIIELINTSMYMREPYKNTCVNFLFDSKAGN